MTIVQVHKNKIILKQPTRGISSFQRHLQKLHSENRCHSLRRHVVGKGRSFHLWLATPEVLVSQQEAFQLVHGCHDPCLGFLICGLGQYTDTTQCQKSS